MSDAQNSTVLSDRISQATEITDIPSKSIMDALEEMGITDDAFGTKVLNASTTNVGLIYEAIERAWSTMDHPSGTRLPIARVQIAAEIIRYGKNPMDSSEDKGGQVKSVMMQQINDQETDDAKFASELIEAIREDKPVEQLSTKEVLSKYLKEFDVDVEAELIKRSKGKRFLAVNSANEVDQESSLVFLKRARRGDEVPTVFVGPDNLAVRIYTVIEYSPGSRVVEVSPFDGTTPLFNGYCSISEMNLSGINDEAKAFMYIIWMLNHDITRSERREIVKAARVGVDTLSTLYPVANAYFQEKKALDDLPRLKKMRDPEIRGTHKADPFNPSNRTY